MPQIRKRKKCKNAHGHLPVKFLMTSFLTGCFPWTPVRRTTGALVLIPFEETVGADDEHGSADRGPARPSPCPLELEPALAFVK